MAGSKLSKTALVALHKVKKARRVKAFAKDARVDLRTVQKMAKGGYCDLAKVRRVQDTLAVLTLEQDRRAALPAAVIEEAVCSRYEIDRETLRQGGRIQHEVEARQVVYLLLLQESGMTKSAIARHLGHDRTAITHNIKRITERLEVETDLRRKVDRIRSLIITAAL